MTPTARTDRRGTKWVLGMAGAIVALVVAGAVGYAIAPHTTRSAVGPASGNQALTPGAEWSFQMTNPSVDGIHIRGVANSLSAETLWQDYAGNPIASVLQTGGFAVFSDKIATYSDVSHPQAQLLPDGGVKAGYAGATIRSGPGAPHLACTKGDVYLRTDAPRHRSQRVYECVGSGSPGTWEGIL